MPDRGEEINVTDEEINVTICPECRMPFDPGEYWHITVEGHPLQKCLVVRLKWANPKNRS